MAANHSERSACAVSIEQFGPRNVTAILTITMRPNGVMNCNYSQGVCDLLSDDARAAIIGTVRRVLGRRRRGGDFETPSGE